MPILESLQQHNTNQMHQNHTARKVTEQVAPSFHDHSQSTTECVYKDTGHTSNTVQTPNSAKWTQETCNHAPTAFDALYNTIDAHSAWGQASQNSLSKNTAKELLNGMIS